MQWRDWSISCFRICHSIHALCRDVEGLSSQVQWRAFLEMTAYVVIVHIHGTGGRGNRESVRGIDNRRQEFLPFGLRFGASFRSHKEISKYGKESQRNNECA